MAEKYLPEEEPKEEQFSVNNLSKAERKFTWKDRNAIISHGNSFKYKSLIFSSAPQTDWQLIIIIRRSFKGAVARNRTKRILREVYRICKPLFSSPMGLIVTVLNNPGHLDFNKVKDLVIKNFMKKNANQ